MPVLGTDQRGFTLLETVIAMAIMLLALSSILAVESNSINASARAKQMNIVAMLAKNTMVETEYKIEGKTFDEVKKEDGGTFPSPYEEYRWSSVIKEIKFPNLNVGGGKSNDGNNQLMEKMTKLMTKFLSAALREVTITVSWKRGSGEQSFAVSTYWVDLNHEFDISQ